MRIWKTSGEHDGSDVISREAKGESQKKILACWFDGGITRLSRLPNNNDQEKHHLNEHYHSNGVVLCEFTPTDFA